MFVKVIVKEISGTFLCGDGVLYYSAIKLHITWGGAPHYTQQTLA